MTKYNRQNSNFYIIIIIFFDLMYCYFHLEHIFIYLKGLVYLLSSYPAVRPSIDFCGNVMSFIFILTALKFRFHFKHVCKRYHHSNTFGTSLKHYSSKMTSKTCIKLDKSVIASGFLDSFDYVLSDCDGVLWSGNNAIPGSVETIQTLKKLGKQIIYVTNNSTKTRTEYLKKCENLGFPAKMENIVSTSYCAAAYLKSKGFQKKAYVFGSTGISQELENANIQCLPVGPDPIPDNWIQWVGELKLDPEVGAVVVGFDHHISYPKLTKAASYLKDPDTLFIATNRDEQFPTEGDLVIPGAGTFVAAVEVVTGRKAIAVGKPEKYMLDAIKAVYPDLDPSRCIMFGDRLNTDIMFGTKNGMKTLLVLTGINSLEDVQKFEQSCDENQKLQIPDYYLQCLGDLKELIQ